jgi:hypothetical protein
MRGLYKLLSAYWFWKAATHGPGSLLRYLARRQIRKAVYRSLDRAFRATGLYGRRRRRNIS